jgi:hypothetical protein
MNRCSRLGIWSGLCVLIGLLLGGTASSALAQGPIGLVKGHRLKDLMSPTGYAALMHVRELRAMRAPGLRAFAVPGDEEEGGDEEDHSPIIPETNAVTAEPGDNQAPFSNVGSGGSGSIGRGLKNVFVNDPCLDPPPTAPFPTNFLRTVQSETEVAVLNAVPDNGDNGKAKSGRLMVAGFNDSWGFYDNRMGLSGFSYSTDGGKLWIDASGLPPVVPSGAPAGTVGSDAYFGDPVVVVHHRSQTFYYASIYFLPNGTFSLSVNRGHFQVAPQQVPIESKANTRCEGTPAAFGTPDPPPFIQERIIWEPPVVAVPVVNPDDFLDKEWLYVDQRTGILYLAYVRFGSDGSSPLELVHSLDGGHTWIGPSIIVPNLNDTFNTGVSVVTTATGRVIVSWIAQTFQLVPGFPTRDERIETAFSDDCNTFTPCTFSLPALVSHTNPQGEPPGYNRQRAEILNVTYLAADKGKYDGAGNKAGNTKQDDGNVYVTYFSGVTALAQAPAPPTTVFARAADIFLSRSTDNGTTWRPRVKVNDDNTLTSHVFPSVQVNEDGIVFDTWLDRRVDPVRNLLTDTWGAISKDDGKTFRDDFRITNVSTDWIARADARPNFGDYNSSEVINFKDFVSIWSDGRFPPPGPLTPSGGGFTRPAAQAATPDVLFSDIGSGLSHGGGGGD